MLQFGGREKRRLLPEFPTGRLLSLSFSLNLQSHLRQTVGGGTGAPLTSEYGKVSWARQTYQNMK